MELASRADRLFARLIDGLLLAAPFFLFTEDLGDAAKLAGCLLFLALLAYQARLLTRDAQTIGKRALKIRVVTVASERNGGFVTNVLKRAVVSGLLNAIPLYFLADSLMIFREDRRCAHDFIAGTRVVKAG
jgi:uncharacterized RDD family membrane protein YckC